MTKFITNFVTNAGMKDILGRGLINDDTIAVIELIKNAKDAGSPKVDLSFQTCEIDLEAINSPTFLSGDSRVDANNKVKLSGIIISDSGKGMTEQEISSKWLNIAYSEKKGSNKSYAGNKGVGRFSCDRLGKLLILYTKSEDGDYIKLVIDWLLFEEKGERDEISKIKLQGEKLDKKTFLKEIEKDSFETGTILKILELRSHWGSKQLKKLLNEKVNIEKLIKTQLRKI